MATHDLKSLTAVLRRKRQRYNEALATISNPPAACSTPQGPRLYSVLAECLLGDDVAAPTTPEPTEHAPCSLRTDEQQGERHQGQADEPSSSGSTEDGHLEITQQGSRPSLSLSMAGCTAPSSIPVASVELPPDPCAASPNRGTAHTLCPCCGRSTSKATVMTVGMARGMGLLHHNSQIRFLDHLARDHPMFTWQRIEFHQLRMAAKEPTCVACGRSRKVQSGTLYNVILGAESWCEQWGGQDVWSQRTRICAKYCCTDCSARHSNGLGKPCCAPLPYQQQQQLPLPVCQGFQPPTEQQQASAWLCGQPMPTGDNAPGALAAAGDGAAVVTTVVYERPGMTSSSVSLACTHDQQVANAVLGVFEGSAGLPRQCVTRIERLHNRKLACAYEAKKQRMHQQLGVCTTNERTLWHGTPLPSLEWIKQDGFLTSCANTKASLGPGVYFAQSSSYSLAYCKKEPGAGGVLEAAAQRKRRRLSALVRSATTRPTQPVPNVIGPVLGGGHQARAPLVMILARVLLGRVDVEGVTGKRQTMKDTDSLGAITTHEGTWQYALFDTAATLPEYLVFLEDPYPDQ